jgi:hypothetical protein
LVSVLEKERMTKPILTPLDQLGIFIGVIWFMVSLLVFSQIADDTLSTLGVVFAVPGCIFFGLLTPFLGNKWQKRQRLQKLQKEKHERIESDPLVAEYYRFYDIPYDFIHFEKNSNLGVIKSQIQRMLEQADNSIKNQDFALAAKIYANIRIQWGHYTKGKTPVEISELTSENLTEWQESKNSDMFLLFRFPRIMNDSIKIIQTLINKRLVEAASCEIFKFESNLGKIIDYEEKYQCGILDMMDIPKYTSEIRCLEKENNALVDLLLKKDQGSRTCSCCWNPVTKEMAPFYSCSSTMGCSAEIVCNPCYQVLNEVYSRNQCYGVSCGGNLKKEETN